MTTNIIDINCDMGESFGVYKIGNDEAIMPYISSANIACGFHAGDPIVMQKTVALAKNYGVKVGAHPGFADLVGFGRRNISTTYKEAYSDVLYQIGSLFAFTQSQNLSMQHVKPHGQLNNLAVKDKDLAQAIVDAVWDFDPQLIFISYGGELTKAALNKGLKVANEVYADREYLGNGQLVPRSSPHAVITDIDRIVSRAITMVQEQKIQTIEGELVAVDIQTICIHGDTPGAHKVAKTLRNGFNEANIAVKPLIENQF